MKKSRGTLKTQKMTQLRRGAVWHATSSGAGAKTKQSGCLQTSEVQKKKGSRQAINRFPQQAVEISSK